MCKVSERYQCDEGCLREGARKKRFYLRLFPKLWIGGFFLSEKKTMYCLYGIFVHARHTIFSQKILTPFRVLNRKGGREWGLLSRKKVLNKTAFF